MALHQTYSDRQHSAARQFEFQEDPAIARREAAEGLQKAKAPLLASPALFSELLGDLTTSDHEALAAALDSGDAIEFARLFAEARDDFADALIDAQVDDQPWLSRGAAAEQLARIYA